MAVVRYPFRIFYRVQPEWKSFTFDTHHVDRWLALDLSRAGRG